MAAARSSAGVMSPTLGTALADLPVWQARLALMVACTVPGLLMRVGGLHVPPLIGCVGFGGAVMAAGFILAAASEVAEIDLPSGLAVAGVAFVAVLPEYVIEIYFAFSGQTELISASLTGSTRLLLSFAVGMPALAAMVLALRGQRRRLRYVHLKPQRRLDLAIIAAASAYAPLIVLRGRITWQDSIVLIGLYVLYLRRVSTGAPEPPALVGMSAELGKLPKKQRKRWVFGLMAYAAVTVLITAEPFAQSVLGAGMMVGVGQYLIVQWLVPLATEMPELVVAFVLIQHQRAGQGVAVLLASAVSQWTLALGTLPIAYAAGAGQGPLPLLGRERVELMLTMALALMAVGTLVTLRLKRGDATLMLVLFVAQIAIGTVLLRAAITLVYLVIAFDILSSERWAIPTLAHALRGRPTPAPNPPRRRRPAPPRPGPRRPAGSPRQGHGHSRRARSGTR
jgi:cation:H+ antiporter